MQFFTGLNESQASNLDLHGFRCYFSGYLPSNNPEQNMFGGKMLNVIKF